MGLVSILRSSNGPRLLAVIVIAVLVSSSLVWVVTSRRGEASSNLVSSLTTASIGKGTPGGAKNPAVEPPPVAPSVSEPTVVPAPTPTTATDPDSALDLTASQAAGQLLAESKASTSLLRPLTGSWVSQVSSKCVGIPVDVEPDWTADGVTDIRSVTVQQILAFNLSLGQRFGAITTRPTQIGISTDRPGSGPCKGKIVWMSVVPNLSTQDEATQWCEMNVPIVHECEARLVATAKAGSKRP